MIEASNHIFVNTKEKDISFKIAPNQTRTTDGTSNFGVFTFS